MDSYTKSKTSPLSFSKDMINGVKLTKISKFNSLFSVSKCEDICLWEKRKNNFLFEL